MGVAKFNFYLDNVFIQTPPVDWENLEILATFVTNDDFGVRTSETAQPSLTIDKFIFVNVNAQKLIKYRKGGVDGTSNGILEGMPFKITVSNGVTTTTVFDGMIDFKSGYREVSPVKVEVKIKGKDSLNNFDDRVRVNSFKYLESIGVFGIADYIDMPLIVQKVNIAAELSVLELTLSTYIISAAKAISDLTKSISTAIAITAAGIGGLISGPILALVTIALDVATLILLINQMIKLLIRMVFLLAPPIQQHKSAFLQTLLEKSFDHLGYKFESTIKELPNVPYIPRYNERSRRERSGVPSIGEVGGTISGLIGVVLRTFGAKIAIIGNTVHIHDRESPFWKKNSTFRLKDIGNFDSSSQDLESEENVFNTPDFTSNFFLSFSSDSSDKWTLEDDGGIETQVIREPKTVSEPKNLLYGGLQLIEIGCARASRKTDLNEIESLLEALQSRLGSIAGTFNNTGLTSNSVIFSYLNTSTRVGVMKVSDDTFEIPKLAYVELQADGTYRIPQDHLNKFSTDQLYNDYYVNSSFSEASNFKGQKKVFTSREIVFIYTNMLQVVNNSYIHTFKGEEGRLTSIKWKLAADTAIADYDIDFVYTKNIKETVISTL